MSIKVTAAGDSKHLSGTKYATVQIKVKGENPMKLTGHTVTLSQAAVKKNTQALSRTRVITVKNPKGRLTFDIMAMNTAMYKNRFTIDKHSGTILVSKGAISKGTFRMHVRVIASGDANYTPTVKAVPVTVIIK